MKEEFTKADLKDGMIVEYRDGRRMLVVNNFLIGKGKEGYYNLNYYSENMKNKDSSDRDIMRAFKIDTNTVLDYIFSTESLELIWERKEVKKMTVKEMQRKLEELTGEKIETEPSREEMIGSIDLYCHSECCSSCAIYSECSGCSTDIVNMPNEKLKECYEKVIKDGNKTKKM